MSGWTYSHSQLFIFTYKSNHLLRGFLVIKRFLDANSSAFEVMTKERQLCPLFETEYLDFTTVEAIIKIWFKRRYQRVIIKNVLVTKRRIQATAAILR